MSAEPSVFGRLARVGRVPSWVAWPTLAILVAGILVPMAIIFLDSFRLRGTYGGFAPIEDLGAYIASGEFLSNYVAAFKGVYLKIFWRSIRIATLTTVLCLAAGYPLAYWLA